jgi:ferredoxin-NADP reductase
MRHLKWVRFGTAVVFGLILTLAAKAAEPDFARCISNDLEQRLLQSIGLKSYYRPILSTDLDFLRTEARFAEGPAPQRNVAIVAPHEQFRFNGETQAILELKKRLIRRYRDRIIEVEKGHGADVVRAAREQFQMMLQELPETSPQIFRREGNTLVNLLTGDRLSASDLPMRDPRLALERLGQMVPDDLVFVKKKGDEFHIIGGNLAFPTRWSLGGAIGEPMVAIHAGLGGNPEKSAAFSTMINRILDRTLVTPEVVRRNNWFVDLDPRYPLPNYQTVSFKAPEKITKRNYQDSVFIRTERQTLRGLPESNTVVFGIQPMVFPIRLIMKDREIAANLLDGIKVKLLPTGNNPDHVAKVAKFIESELSRDPSSVATKVLASEKVNDSTYLLRVKKPADLQLVPGEAIRVTLNTSKGNTTRTLSLASSPQGDDLEFAVKDSESEFKQTFKSLKAGDPIKLELTRTSLEFKPEKPAVMIAGGIGITPFRSFIQYVKDKKLDTPMWLFYGNRNQIAFETEINQAAKVGSKLNVTHVLSRGDSSWQGERGRIDEAYLQKVIPSLPADAIYYVVASPQMANDTRAALTKLGIPENRISIEAFPGYEAKSGGTEKPAFDPAQVQDHQTVCYCHRVSAGALRSAIQNGASTLAELKSQTHAATGCGGCECNVMSMLQCEMVKAIPNSGTK